MNIVKQSPEILSERSQTDILQNILETKIEAKQMNELVKTIIVKLENVRKFVDYLNYYNVSCLKANGNGHLAPNLDIVRTLYEMMS